MPEKPPDKHIFPGVATASAATSKVGDVHDSEVNSAVQKAYELVAALEKLKAPYEVEPTDYTLSMHCPHTPAILGRAVKVYRKFGCDDEADAAQAARCAIMKWQEDNPEELH